MSRRWFANAPREGLHAAGKRVRSTMKIRIRMEAYDHQALDASAKEIVDHAKRPGAKVAGPVPLPTSREIYTLNLSLIHI